MAEASIGSLRCAVDDLNSMPENRIVDEERRHNDFEIQLSDGLDILMVDGCIVEREDSSIHTKGMDSTII